MKTQHIVIGTLAVVLLACSKGDGSPAPDEVNQPEPKSSEKLLISFRLTGIVQDGIAVDIPADIDQGNKAVEALLPPGTDITALEPLLEISDKATYEPLGPQDFSTPVNYTVTAEDGTSQTYLVTLEVSLSQKEILLKIADINPANTLNWNPDDELSDWEEVKLDSTGNIIELRLNSRDISLLPPEIGLFSKLQKLNLTDNPLFTLPPEFWQLYNLRELELMAIGLTTLPPEIGQLEDLLSLDLSVNNLVHLPPEIGQLSNLRELFLSTNELSDLPHEIGQLSNLTGLYLSNNSIADLPTEIGQLSKLQVLYLSSNELTSLTPELGQLGSLGGLILSGNQLTEIPPEFRQLSGLIVLDISNNKLSSLGTHQIPMFNSDPLTISCESNLQVLWLDGNQEPMVLDDCICELDKDNGGTVDIDIVKGTGTSNPEVVCQGDVIGN